jgi:hypothetical protein
VIYLKGNPENSNRKVNKTNCCIIIHFNVCKKLLQHINELLISTSWDSETHSYFYYLVHHINIWLTNINLMRKQFSTSIFLIARCISLWLNISTLQRATCHVAYHFGNGL